MSMNYNYDIYLLVYVIYREKLVIFIYFVKL